MAKLLASVAPDVKMISFGSAPTREATWRQAVKSEKIVSYCRPMRSMSHARKSLVHEHSPANFGACRKCAQQGSWNVHNRSEALAGHVNMYTSQTTETSQLTSTAN